MPRWQKILLQWKGACDFRAFISVLIFRYAGFPARQNSNTEHTNPEVYYEGRWHKQELSGAPAPSPPWEPEPIRCQGPVKKPEQAPLTSPDPPLSSSRAKREVSNPVAGIPRRKLLRMT